jgi:hypothetical protein
MKLSAGEFNLLRLKVAKVTRVHRSFGTVRVDRDSVEGDSVDR